MIYHNNMKGEVMKNILPVISLLVLSLPAFASCPITGGACRPGSELYTPPLQEHIVPNYLQELQSPSLHSVRPNPPMIKTQSGVPTGGAAGIKSCQFGLCLPKETK